MPCFSDGPTPGTPEYDEWLPDIRRKLDSFIHVVDYYYRMAGIEMPELPLGISPWELLSGESLGDDRVLDQILFHLDCDDIGMLDLHDIRLLWRNDPALRAGGYSRVLHYCLTAFRCGFHEHPMTALMWAECQDPAVMLDRHLGQVSDRQFRLFAVACCRRMSHLMPDPQSQMAVDVAERFADGLASDDELAAVGALMRVQIVQEHEGPIAVWPVATSALVAARNTARTACANRRGMGEERHQANLLRCIAGNPFRPVEFTPHCRTETAVAMARGMYASRDFSAMPILADALQEGGCNDAAILEHCRDPNADHARGCWVVDGILDQS